MRKILLIIFIHTFSACSTIGAAKMVKSTSDGGRVMIIGSNSWMEKKSLEMASADMAKKCPKGFDITEEGLMERPADVALSGQTHVQEKYIEFKCK